MANDWKMHKQEGGFSGDLLDTCEIRKSADGTAYEIIAVLATKTDGGALPEAPFPFPEFEFRGLHWNINVQTFKYEGRDEGFGHWSNNAEGAPADETGTYTAQAESGVPEEGEEDAASASA